MNKTLLLVLAAIFIIVILVFIAYYKCDKKYEKCIDDKRLEKECGDNLYYSKMLCKNKILYGCNDNRIDCMINFYNPFKKI